MKKSTLLLFLLASFSIPLFSQQLISGTFVGSISKAELTSSYFVSFPYGVDMYKIQYTTPDIHEVQDTASGLLVVPDVEDKVYPLLCYQHGTVGSKTDVPSNLKGGYELAAVFGGMGYVTIAADFLGLGDSRGFHPYLHADTEASAAIDMLFATKEFATENNIFLNDQLFIAGYSQGGHAAMAAHREIQQSYGTDFTVTAAAPMSGPYSISGSMRDFIINEEPYNYVGYLPNTILSYNEAYDLFDNLEEVFKPAYVEAIEKYYNHEITLGILNTQLIAQLILEEGNSIPKFMLQDSVVEKIETDMNHPMNQALADNDVHFWTPDAPTRLYYCQADDQVVYTNSLAADSVMNALGAEDVKSVDVNPSADHGGCVLPAVLATLNFFGAYQTVTTDTENQEFSISSIQLSPNPASDFVVVKNIPEKTTIRIIDLKGQNVYEAPANENEVTINTGTFYSGIYFLQIQGEFGVMSKKLVVSQR